MHSLPTNVTQQHEIHKTCHSVTFHFMKKKTHFLILARLPNMTRAEKCSWISRQQNTTCSGNMRLQPFPPKFPYICILSDFI